MVEQRRIASCMIDHIIYSTIPTRNMDSNSGKIFVVLARLAIFFDVMYESVGLKTAT